MKIQTIHYRPAIPTKYLVLKPGFIFDEVKYHGQLHTTQTKHSAHMVKGCTLFRRSPKKLFIEFTREIVHFPIGLPIGSNFPSWKRIKPPIANECVIR